MLVRRELLCEQKTSLSNITGGTSAQASYTLLTSAAIFRQRRELESTHTYINAVENVGDCRLLSNGAGWGVITKGEFKGKEPVVFEGGMMVGGGGG